MTIQCVPGPAAGSGSAAAPGEVAAGPGDFFAVIAAALTAAADPAQPATLVAGTPLPLATPVLPVPPPSAATPPPAATAPSAASAPPANETPPAPIPTAGPQPPPGQPTTPARPKPTAVGPKHIDDQEAAVPETEVSDQTPTGPTDVDPAQVQAFNVAALVAAPPQPTTPGPGTGAEGSASPKLDAATTVPAPSMSSTPVLPSDPGTPTAPVTVTTPVAVTAARRTGPAHRSDTSKATSLAVAGSKEQPTESAAIPAQAPGSARPLPVTAVQPIAPTSPDAAPPAPQHGEQGVAATAAVAAPTSPSAAAPAAPNTTSLDHVTAQVFPEVTSLVSRGNGTRRIALTLNPEHLGEVRVVLTMRAGAVHVRLAAGQEARASLLDGSPELGRMLERAGASTARVVVRELPGAPALPRATSTSTSTSTTDSTSPGQFAGLGGDRAPDQHAGTRADQMARDGSEQHPPRSSRTEGTTAAPTSAPRSIEPVVVTRTAGVDLTM